MASKIKVNKPGGNSSKKTISSGFLFNEDIGATSSNFEETDDDRKDFHDTLDDSVSATKKDIETNKQKQDEINKILSITKDSKKRNYYTDQLQDKKDELKNKNELLKNQQASLKRQEEEKKKPDSQRKEVAPILATSTNSAKDVLNIKEMQTLRKRIKNTILENMHEEQPVHNKEINQNNASHENNLEQKEKKPSFKVVFDKSTEKPWTVLFTERGFLVGGKTRLSFENIHSAINKNYNIVLDAGQGLVLDQIKMNKILKYENRF